MKPYRPQPQQTASEQYAIGRNALKELLASDRDIDKIFVLRGDREFSLLRLLDQAKERRIPIVTVERAKLDAMAGTTSHQGVVISVSARNYVSIDEILQVAESRGEPPFLVLCDGVEDPHNLGAIIRTAECAGAHGVIIPKRRAVGLTAVVSKASAGALSHMAVARVTNLADTVERLKEKGLWIYAADMDGTPCYGTDMTGSAAFVFGAEGQGISPLLRKLCDFTVQIPLYGKVNSLNVSNAAAVILCEAARQRHKKS